MQATGEHVLILKHGRPVAELSPPTPTQAEYPQHDLAGSVSVLGDIIEPVVPEEDWESLR